MYQYVQLSCPEIARRYKSQTPDLDRELPFMFDRFLLLFSFWLRNHLLALIDAGFRRPVLTIS